MLRSVGIILAIMAALGCSTASKEAERIADFGTKMAREGLWREAEFRWKQAAELLPDDYRLLCNLGVAAEKRGDYETALRLYNRALAIKPGDKAVKFNYENLKTVLDSQRPDDK